MQPVSARWLPAILAGRLQIVTVAQVWTPPTAAAPVGTQVGQFNVVSGQLTASSKSAIRRSLSSCLLVPAPADPLGGVTVPNVNTDDLFPDGNELVLMRGVQYIDGTTETPQIGRILMEDVEIYNEGKGVYIEVNGRDRGGTIDRAGFPVPYATDGVSTLDVQLTALLMFAVPYLPLNITPSTFVPAQMTFKIGDSPWTSALSLAASGGYELFPDVFGTIVGRPVVDPHTLPTTMTYDGTPGNTAGIITEIQRSLVTTSVPNVIIVISQGSNIPTPLISYWWDSDIASPTFYCATVPVPGGNMSSLPVQQGTYPYTTSTLTNSAATTQAQNDSIAQSKGYAARGTFETAAVYIRDNAAQDLEDVIAVIEPGSLVTPKLYAVNTLTMDLGTSSPLEIQAQLVA
jgi:hypothetical protein